MYSDVPMIWLIYLGWFGLYSILWNNGWVRVLGSKNRFSINTKPASGDLVDTLQLLSNHFNEANLANSPVSLILMRYGDGLGLLTGRIDFDKYEDGFLRYY